jgi:hypothetical protein
MRMKIDKIFAQEVLKVQKKTRCTHFQSFQINFKQKTFQLPRIIFFAGINLAVFTLQFQLCLV